MNIPYYRNQLFTLIMNRSANLNNAKILERSPYIQSVFDKYVNRVDTTIDFLNNLKRITQVEKKKGYRPFNASQLYKRYL